MPVVLVLVVGTASGDGDTEVRFQGLEIVG